MQPHEIGAGSRAGSARLGGPNVRSLRAGGRSFACQPPADLGVSRSASGDKPLQLVPREEVPQAQRRERKGLRPVRIETEQPGPDQAV
jgi:hypothetical protein